MTTIHKANGHKFKCFCHVLQRRTTFVTPCLLPEMKKRRFKKDVLINNRIQGEFIFEPLILSEKSANMNIEQLLLLKAFSFTLR